MKVSDVIAGLQILQPYYMDPGGYNVGSGHDTIYAYPTRRPVSPDDVARMVELGWIQEEVNRGGDDDFRAEHYDPGEPWAAYL